MSSAMPTVAAWPPRPPARRAVRRVDVRVAATRPRPGPAANISARRRSRRCGRGRTWGRARLRGAAAGASGVPACAGMRGVGVLAGGGCITRRSAGRIGVGSRCQCRTCSQWSPNPLTRLCSGRSRGWLGSRNTTNTWTGVSGRFSTRSGPDERRSRGALQQFRAGCRNGRGSAGIAGHGAAPRRRGTPRARVLDRGRRAEGVSIRARSRASGSPSHQVDHHGDLAEAHRAAPGRGTASPRAPRGRWCAAGRARAAAAAAAGRA